MHPHTSLLRVAALILASTLTAQFSTAQEQPSGRVPEIFADITLDGNLQEEVWARALVLDQFQEVIPVEGIQSDPATRIHLMRSATHLYIGIECMEPDRDGMVLQNMGRDAFLNEDDRIEMVFDTFHDAKTSYFFQISAAGSRGDALLGDNGRRFNKPWDGYWKGKTRVLADRWIAEIAIPFASMSFGANDIWGANFQRTRGANLSTHRWAAARRELFLGNVSEAGTLSGFAGIQQGSGIEFLPYFKLRSLHPQGGDAQLLGDVGGEINWSMTPQLTASLTWNTDFAETEVDDRQVNLTRFPLFFPEKRDFFLQDSTMFQFGERGRRGGSGSDLVPFFSRRIGLAGGREIPLDAGVRLAGRAGPWDLGFLGVHAAESPEAGTPSGDLFVFRPSYNVSNSLAVGGLFTSGNPLRDLSNSVVGADLRWSSTSVLPGNASLNSYFLHSDDEAIGRNGLAFGSSFSLATSNWQYAVGLLATQNDFAPGLGFVRRPGERRTNASIRWNPRPQSGPVRSYGFGIAPVVWSSLGGDTISSRVRFTLLEADMHSGDRLSLSSFLSTDRPESSFQVADGVAITPGTYRWLQHRLRLSSSSARPLSCSLAVGGGGWYGGDIVFMRAGLTWRPDASFNLGLSYNEERGNLSAGDFTVRIERLSIDYALNSEVSLETLVQSDNQTDTLGLQSRFRWILEDGRELFVVLDSGWRELASGAIIPTENDLTAKVIYAIRF